MITCAPYPISLDFHAICSDFGKFFRLTCLYKPPMINRFGPLGRGGFAV